ncbi:MAG TPA: Fic family protein [Gemmatimonadaceae bacterium]|jgi:hypothetical protein|nr:Fic family protein [Gemmatimonadaceae bacterium]
MPPRRSTETPRARALAWWKAHVDAHQYVLPISDVPSAAVLKVLRQDKLVLDVANKRVLILTEPTRTDERSIFVRNYWAVVDTVLQRYMPAGIAGIEAVHLHLGEAAPPHTLSVVHAANQSEYRLELFGEFTLRLRPALVAADRLVRLPAAGVDVSVLRASDLLVTLDLQAIELNVPAMSAWLRHLVLRTGDLQEAVDAWRRPNVLARLSRFASELGNVELAQQIDAAVSASTSHAISASSTGIGTRIHIPQPLRTASRGTGSPWLDRQAMALAQHRDTLIPLLEQMVGPPPDVDRRILLAHARRVKSYDAYHNTTLEGYRITKEVSDAVVNGEPLPNSPSPTEWQAIMAVQGYSHAFDYVLTQIRGAPPPITAALMLDLYSALFRPSVDAGCLAPEDLHGWRTSAVGLAGGWRHVPPNYKKVPDLIEGLTEFLAHDTSPLLVKAVLAHVEFVTIHPFLDGNGRIGRLLMNYALLSAGYPWITIRSDERTPYFVALERTQVDEDATEFGQFLGHHLPKHTWVGLHPHA